MAAYHSTAFRAAPLRRFFLYERFHALGLNEIEVLYHTHMVFDTIALIQVFQPAARIIRAVITEPDQPFAYPVALVRHKSTVLSAWPAARAVPFLEPFPVQVVFPRQVGDAYSAIHPTGGNQYLFHKSDSTAGIFVIALICPTNRFFLKPKRGNSACCSPAACSYFNNLIRFNEIIRR
jgi:hypothetical protein